MVTIIVGCTKCKIAGLQDKTVIKIFDTQMSYTIQGHQFMNSQNGWDGRHRLFTKNHYFPIGLLPRAKEILEEFDIDYQIIDNRPNLNYGSPLQICNESNFEPRDYQVKAVNLAWQNGSGVIQMATGSGKTATLSLIAGKFNIPTVIYVIGIELLYQMKDTLQKLFPSEKIGMVGDGHCDIQKITISTIWTAAAAFGKKTSAIDSDLTIYSKSKDKLNDLKKTQIRKMIGEAELFILDECQICGSDTVDLLHKESVSAKHRFLLSGTPYRSDGANILIEAVGGPIIYRLNASDLIDKGILVPPKIHFINISKKLGMGKSYQEIYKNFITENDERNQIIAKAAKKLVNDGRKVLILVTKIEHGKRILELLKNTLRVSSLDGTNSSDDRISDIKKMKNGELDVLVASKIFDQGIDIPELSALILAGSGKSPGRALQRIGRVIRGFSGKKDAIVVDFMDDCKYLKEHSKMRKQIYLSERKFKIIEQKK
jgi:superfamily II DNA or RNA helicase